MKKFKTALIIGLIAMMAMGCQAKEEVKPANPSTEVSEETQNFQNKYPEFITGETTDTVSYKSGDKEITISKKPKKVAILQNSMLDLWYLAGGEAIARADGKTNVPDEALALPTLGKTSEINIENLIAMEPDLVVLSTAFSSQMELIPLLEENNIEYAPITANTTPYQGFQENMYLFSKILGKEDAYNEKIASIQTKVDQIIEKTKKVKKQPTTVVLFSSTKNVQCELESSLTGEMVAMLGAQNIVEGLGVEGENKVDFSMEKLAERDPDFILITTMGDVDKCKARIEKDIMANDAWATLTAVKEGRIYYLPSELFMYRPNNRYPEAFESLAKILYPEVF